MRLAYPRTALQRAGRLVCKPTSKERWQQSSADPGRMAQFWLLVTVQVLLRHSAAGDPFQDVCCDCGHRKHHHLCPLLLLRPQLRLTSQGMTLLMFMHSQACIIVMCQCRHDDVHSLHPHISATPSPSFSDTSEAPGLFCAMQGHAELTRADNLFSLPVDLLLADQSNRFCASISCSSGKHY